MKKIIAIIILVVSFIGTIWAEKVKIGDLYYNLDESTHTAEVSQVGETESDHISIPSLITFNGARYIVTSIGNQAFMFCRSSIVSIPNSIVTISNSAFESHHRLKSINVANDNPYYCSIDGVLFDKHRTTLIQYPSGESGTYVIPNGVINIVDRAFEGCSGLTSVTIPNSVINIGERAFDDCSGLTSVTIPNSVINIGEMAFSNCSSLTSVTIPNSVTNIGGNAFSWSSLSSINVVNDNPYYCSIDGVLFDKQRTTLIQYPCGKPGEYIIPNNVTIEYDAFDQCWGLTSITIPTNISGLQDSGLLKAWSSLSSINVVDDNPYYSSIDGVLFDKQRTTLIKCPSKKQGTYAIPYGVISIGEGAFDHCKLTNITIPNSVTHIGRGAFYECYGLNSIIIPNSVINIGDDAFHGVYSIEYYGSASGCPWGAKSINENFVEESLVYSDETKTTLLACLHGATGDIVIPKSVTSIRDSAFMSCYDVTSVSVPKGVTTIGKSAFYGIANVIYSGKAVGSPWGATYLNAYSEGLFVYGDKNKNQIVYSPAAHGDIAIPSSVINIGDSAFYFSELTSVTIPNSVISIGNYAFSLDYLTDVTIPESVQFTGKYPFNECSWLTAVTWNAINCSTYDDGQYVYPPFQNCENITSFTIGENVEALPRGLCYGLPITHIAIPPKVRYIGTSAFRECKKLTSVIIVGDVQFGSSVFEDCPNVIVYTTNPTMSIPGVPAERVKKVTYQQLYDYPFSIFAKSFVEEEVNKWQQKGEYERISDWQQRVNEQTRQQKINELLANAEQKYVEHWQPQTQLSLQLGKYDADNEVYALHDVQYGDVYMPVPIRDAKSFKENWEDKQFTYSLQIRDDQFKLASVSITMPNGKKYISHASDDVNYNIADIEYNFSPIDLNIASSNGSQGRPNISTRKIKAGISDVDTNIPETEAYNPNTFVVIFANEDYRYVASVPYAKNDGKIFQQYCEKTLGIPADNIHHVENASLNDIRYHLAWLNKVCDAYNGNASLIVYYAGHGIPDEANKTAYLLPSDGNSTYVQSAYKLDDFYQKLGAMSAKSVTVFMDACFSGSKREEGMLASARGVAIKAKNGLPQGNMVVFSAATGDETAYPNNEEHHGMFTYYLLKKLQETEGNVTLKDLGDYIATNVRQQSIVKNGKSQTPTITPSATLTADWQNWKLK